MMVVCTDGTAFQCRSYQVIDTGVMLFGEELETNEEENRYDSDEEQIGYVPNAYLRYIVPNEVFPQTPTAMPVGGREQGLQGQGQGYPPQTAPDAPPQSNRR